MITLAQITAISLSTNLCTVKVPLLSGIGTNVVLEATMLLPPGIHSGYKVDDIVFLSFTENDLGRPIVLGQLFLGNTSEVTAKDQAGVVACETLEVEGTGWFKNITLYGSLDATAASGSITLPTTTVFGGATYQDLLNTVVSLQNTVATLNNTINGLATQVDQLQRKVSALEATS